jgi:hypothetical protein
MCVGAHTSRQSTLAITGIKIADVGIGTPSAVIATNSPLGPAAPGPAVCIDADRVAC